MSDGPRPVDTELQRAKLIEHYKIPFAGRRERYEARIGYRSRALLKWRVLRPWHLVERD